MHSIGYSFTLVRKGYDNHHCHNKTPNRNVTGVWMTSCPEEMVLRIWKIWKNIQLSSDHGVENLSSAHGIEKLSPDHWSDPGAEKLRLDHKMCRALECC